MSDRFSAGNSANRPNIDGQDKHRLVLGERDFDSMDVDRSESLSLVELTIAAQSGKFTGDKKTAVEGLRDFLGPPTRTSDTTESTPVVRKWNSLKVAMKNISDSEFETIDRNGDGVLSKHELGNLEKLQSPVDKQAANYLLKALDNQVDTRGILGVYGVNNWHSLDPMFEHADYSMLKLLAKDVKDTHSVSGKELFEEILRRDKFAHPKEFLDELLIYQKALQDNVKAERNQDGQLELTSEPLGPYDRFDLHEKLVDTVKRFDRSRTSFLDYSTVLMANHKSPADAEKQFQKAIALADTVHVGHKTESGNVTISNVIEKEIEILKTEHPHLALTITAQSLRNTIDAPISTRNSFAVSCLAPTILENKDVVFHASAANFQPDKAQKLLDESRIYTMSILGFDPRTAKAGAAIPDKTSLFQSSWRSDDPTNKYNLFFDGNKDGKSDLLEKIKANTTLAKWTTGTIRGNLLGLEPTKGN